MDNDAIVVEHSLDEQHSRVDNQKRGKSTQNQSNSGEIVKSVNKMKHTPMNPTHLYISFFLFSIILMYMIFFIREYSCWSTYRTATAAGAFAIFINIVILTGVLTVYFTLPKQSGMLF